MAVHVSSHSGIVLWDAIQVITAFTVLGNFDVGLSSLLSRNVQLVWDVCPSFIIGTVSKQEVCTNVCLVPFSHNQLTWVWASCKTLVRPGLRSHWTSFICSLVTWVDCSNGHWCSFPNLALFVSTLVASAMCTTPRKVHYKEDGLQEMNVRVNTNTICRINIFSSNIDGQSGEVKVSSMNASETWMMTNGKEIFTLAEQLFSFCAWI